MAILFPNGINVPNEKLQEVADAFHIVQEEGETAQEAFVRLSNQMLWELRRKVITHKKKKVAEEAVADADYLTEI